MINFFSACFLPFFIIIIFMYAYFKNIDIYDAFVSGAKEGPKTTLKILPAMIAMFCAVNLLNVSGIVTWITKALSGVFAYIGFDSNLIPIILIRPISGTGAYAILSNIYKIFTPDSFIGLCASIMCGCTETTFYVITVYFGSLGIKNMRFAVKAALLADFVGFIFAYIISLIFFA